ncbi:zinc-dependent metalloprotease [Prevotella sp. HUN102]|uniref:zinc-dependent metalloprotease n=1 Tax=Prevotella sp. HUN102 TaxID=1392486 RepID=UPI00048BE917|nr:zinc-dependent metalloprotease [Prevotella sp. HUN102]
MRINKTLAVVALAMTIGSTGSFARSCFSSFAVNDSTEQASKETDGKADRKKNDKDDKKDKKDKLSDYEKLIKKGGSVEEGLFTVRHIEDKWYVEVPDSVLGRYMLAVTRFSSVPQNFGKFAGEELSEATIYFEQRDAKTLLLKAFVQTHEANPNDRISITLAASTADPIIAALKVIGRNKKKDKQLVDISPLFVKDNNIVSLSASDAKFLKLGGLQADRTFIDTLKVYPINLEVASTRTYASPTPNSPASYTGSVTIGLNTSIVLLPKHPMRKRFWDNRVGYFTNRRTVFSDDQNKTQHEQVISRFELVPKDVKKYKKGELVEPVTPIIFYIDPATPKQWVPYLKAGIDDWNVAFEAAGFKNAIQGKEWPEDSDMSLDDAHYSVVRYLPAEIENAYGPRIVDPRSGQIIESHVCWYHNVMNLLTKWYMIQCGPLDKRAQKMKFDPELMGELIRFVSSHEVGHALGLRHNMGASHATPVEKLRDKAWVEANGHTASIMDYARFNYVAQPEDGISTKGIFPRINDYDKWAIKWGYQYRPDFKDEFEEKEGLLTETTNVLAKNPRLWFGGEGRGEDPRAQTEDLGDDNVKASEYGLKNLKRVVNGLPEWTKQTNDRTDDLKEMWKAVKDQFNRYNNHVLKNIGGRYNNNVPGKKPYEVAPASKQKAAVEYLGRNLFEAPMWLYPSNIIDITGTDVVSDIAGQQQRVLSRMMSVDVLGNVYKYQDGSAVAYQLESYLDDLYKAVWKPLAAMTGSNLQARRLLQRAYINNVNTLLNPAETPAKDAKTPTAARQRTLNSDIQLYLEQQLDRIEQFCKAQSAQGTGINTRHFKDLLRQIKLVKERRTTVK